MEDAQGEPNTPAPLKEPSETGLSVIVDPDEPDLDIVFIHGFTGHPKNTWAKKIEISRDNANEKRQKIIERFKTLRFSSRQEENDVKTKKIMYWPRDLVPDIAPNARVLTYGYDTHIRHKFSQPINPTTVYGLAWNFLVEMEAQRRTEPTRPLVFVAHSLGGIIVKEALRRSQECVENHYHLQSIFNHTRSIIFFGTPHGGADPRNLIHHVAQKCVEYMGFSVNEQVLNALLPTSERLKELSDSFAPVARRQNWMIFSFQEQYPVKMLNKKVVKDTASCLGHTDIEITQHIACNHMEMCRFDGKDDVEFGKVSSALSRITNGDLNSAISRTELSDRENSELRQKLLDSLAFEQIDARYATITDAHALTCRWFVDDPDYQDWLNDKKLGEHHGFLWIKGKPAAGKSTIMKYALEHTQRTRPKSVIISFFFNARGDDLEKSVLGMYRSLLYQLLRKVPKLKSLLGNYKPNISLKNEHQNFTWSIEVLKSLFKSAIGSLGQRNVVCFIDALDECDEDQIRDMVRFWGNLGEQAVTESQFCVCFSSRHYPNITFEKGIEVILQNKSGHSKDIANYVRSELKAGQSDLVEQIKMEILEKAAGIFLWVALVVPILNREYDHGHIHALRRRLDDIPKKLDELLEDILTKDRQNLDEMKLCIQWILYAKRPLEPRELYFAILAGLNDAEEMSSIDSLDIADDDIERFVLSSSKGLAELTKSVRQTVQFIHESVPDYLRKANGLERPLSDHIKYDPGQSHECLKRSCYKYLAMGSDSSKFYTLTLRLPIEAQNDHKYRQQIASTYFPFLKYASQYLFYHADAAQGNGISQQEFLDHFSLGEYVEVDKIYKFLKGDVTDASLLYILAEQNLPQLMRIVLKHSPNINIEGGEHHFPLHAALKNKNEFAVRALLLPERDIFIGKSISHEINKNHEAIRAFLNQESVDDDIVGRATVEGNLKFLELLLKKAIHKLDPDYVMTQPFVEAASKGYEDVVKLVLANVEIDASLKDRQGRTALSYAARNDDWQSVVEQLLKKKDVDVASVDEAGLTPLWYAVENHNTRVLKLLLANSDVDINLRYKDRKFKTLLTLASEKDYQDLVELLLLRADINVNTIDGDNDTAIMHAARNGHEEVYKLLLAREDIDVNLENTKGETLALILAKNDCKDLLALLLTRADVNVTSVDGDGYTTLFYAVMGGMDEVVTLLLTRIIFDLNKKHGIKQQTLLFTGSRERVYKHSRATDEGRGRP